MQRLVDPASSPLRVGLQTDERRRQIAALLRERERITVAELSRVFGVSAVAIRRDLDQLASNGQAVRTRGGAQRSGPTSFMHDFFERAKLQAAEKSAIARIAAGLVTEGDTIFLDSGTTTYQIARTLHGVKRLTVLTNSFPVAMDLGSDSDITVIVLGGLFRPGSLSCNGPLTLENAQRFQLSKVFLGAEGLTVEHGLRTKDMLESEVVRAMLTLTKQVIAVTDSAKLGRVGFLQTAPIENIHMLITDWQAPADIVEALRAKGVEVLVAHPGE